MQRVRLVVIGVAAAILLASCLPVAPPVVQTCDPHWRGYVLPSDHNYAGIGAYNTSVVYMCKPTVTQGVRAHMQHLRNYADPSSMPENLGAPFEARVGYTAANYTSFRYHGQAPRWFDLNGRWAVPGTTYAQTIFKIYNQMRARWGLPAVSSARSIMGASELTAAQIAQYVLEVGNPWKPEVSRVVMATVYLNEGAKAGIRGDVAFCQSILETGWFSWPTSPAAATESVPSTEPSTTSTTTTTAPGAPGAPTTTTGAAAPTTTTTAVPAPPTTPPAVDPVLAAYFELQRATFRY